MSEKPEYLFAFPQQITPITRMGAGFVEYGQPEFKGGMTLRDYFAASALQGLLSNPNLKDEILICPAAYNLADKMLKARAA